MKLSNDEFDSLMHYVLAASRAVPPDHQTYQNGVFSNVSGLLDDEAQARGWSSWSAAIRELPPLRARSETETVTETTELIGHLTLPDPLVWLTRKSKHLGPDARCLVNLAGVDAITPDEDGCCLYWMSGQTAWDVTETIEEVHALMTGGTPSGNPFLDILRKEEGKW